MAKDLIAARLRNARWKRTAKGKAANARYKRSAKGKAANARYRRSPKGKATQARFERTVRAKARHARAKARKAKVRAPEQPPSRTTWPRAKVQVCHPGPNSPE